jgi:hypothetical protein
MDYTVLYYHLNSSQYHRWRRVAPDWDSIRAPWVAWVRYAAHEMLHSTCMLYNGSRLQVLLLYQAKTRTPIPVLLSQFTTFSRINLNCIATTSVVRHWYVTVAVKWRIYKFMFLAVKYCAKMATRSQWRHSCTYFSLNISVHNFWSATNFFPKSLILTTL